ncbi:SapC family protein [Caulobacter sp.]|uniref:SapC family protein n=1 Tax=Caulobacter sp. TaxID=78 RepID=UPI003BA9B2E2
MTNRVLLNNVDHADLRAIVGYGPRFGDNVNQALLLPTEFEEAQREYPILLRKDPQGDYQAVALLGLDRDENLFLDGGEWRARYVPAVQQRGPFSIALQDAKDGGAPRPMIHVDLDHPRVSTSEGLPLFLPAGGNAPYLQHMIGVLGAIYDGLEVAKPMFAAFSELDLIEPVAIAIELVDGATYDLPDFHTIAADRLAALSGGDLERLHHSGLLRAAQWLVSSMGNVQQLVEMKNRRLVMARAGEGLATP